MRFIIVLSALLAMLAAPASAAPASNASVAAQRASMAEALAFVRAYSPSELRREAELTTLRRDFVKGLQRDAGIKQMLDAFPGLDQALVDAMASQIDIYIAEYDERFFPPAAAIVREGLTRDDVLKLTAFYASPLGRKALKSVVSNIDVSEVIDRALQGKDIDAGVATRQVMKAGVATYAGLSTSEKATVLALASSPAGIRFRGVIPKLTALQVELTNHPGPKFEAGSNAAMGAAIKRFTGVNPLNQ
jgi:hypothetical protein